MKRYELTILVKNVLNIDEIKNISSKISKFIEEKEGKIEEITEAIKKKTPSLEERELFLVDLYFSVSPDKIEEIKKYILEEENIIRHMIVEKKKKIEDKIEKREKKSELKEIDEKIDEILNIDND